MAKKQTNRESPEVLEGKIFAVLAYLSIFCIIPLVLKKDNAFVLYHGRQGLVIFIAEVAVYIIHIILGLWLYKLGMFTLGVLSLIAIVGVLKGEYVKLPFVSAIAGNITL